MVFQPKDPAIVSADSFENTVPIKKSMIEHGNPCVAFPIKLAIDIDDHAIKLKPRYEREACKAIRELATDKNFEALFSR